LNFRTLTSPIIRIDKITSNVKGTYIRRKSQFKSSTPKRSLARCSHLGVCPLPLKSWGRTPSPHLCFPPMTRVPSSPNNQPDLAIRPLAPQFYFPAHRIHYFASFPCRSQKEIPPSESTTRSVEINSNPLRHFTPLKPADNAGKKISWKQSTWQAVFFAHSNPRDTLVKSI